jgi:CsoR family transcriptional regulator, copper-sensing transcriptional repressor
MPSVLVVPFVPPRVVAGVMLPVVIVIHLPSYTLGGYHRQQTNLRGGIVETATRGYSATKGQLLDRLARIEGQVRGVQRMVEEDRYCIDVVTQINAARAALDKVALGLLDGHVRHCLVEGHGGPTDPDAQTKELMGAVGRLLSR